jgi:hypothetical protein
MDGNARTAAPAIALLLSSICAGCHAMPACVCVCACALFVTQPNTMNKVSAIVLKKATAAAAAAVASRSHVTSSSLKNKNGYARSLFVFDGQIRGKRDDG